jgi:hypothetical protein
MSRIARKVVFTAFIFAAIFGIFGATNPAHAAADQWYAVITNVTNIKCEPNGVFYTPYLDRNLPAGSTYKSLNKVNGIVFTNAGPMVELYNLQYVGTGYGYVQYGMSFATGYKVTFSQTYFVNGAITSSSYFEITCPQAKGAGILSKIIYNKDGAIRAILN